MSFEQSDLNDPDSRDESLSQGPQENSVENGDNNAVTRYLEMVLEAFNVTDIDGEKKLLEECDIILHQEGGIATIWLGEGILNIVELVVNPKSQKQGLAAQIIWEAIRKNNPKFICTLTDHPALTSILDQIGPDIVEGPEFDLVVAAVQRDGIKKMEVGSRIIIKEAYGKEVIQKKADFSLDPLLSPGDAFLHIKKLS